MKWLTEGWYRSWCHCDSRRKRKNISPHPALIYDWSTAENTKAHLLCDIKLRTVGVTQSKLLGARQRPPENRWTNLSRSDIKYARVLDAVGHNIKLKVSLQYFSTKNKNRWESENSLQCLHEWEKVSVEENCSVGVKVQHKGKKLQQHSCGQIEPRGGGVRFITSTPEIANKRTGRNKKYCLTSVSCVHRSGMSRQVLYTHNDREWIKAMWNATSQITNKPLQRFKCGCYCKKM